MKEKIKENNIKTKKGLLWEDVSSAPPKKDSDNGIEGLWSKFKTRKDFIQIIIAIAIILLGTGVSFGTLYYENFSLIKEAKKLMGEEKYEEAIRKLNLAQASLIVEKLSIGKREIDNEINENKERLDGKSKYEQAVVEINEDNLQEAISLLSELPESSFYYQKAQTKIEEAKRKMVEGKLSEEQVARKGAEAKAKQEEFEKKLKEEQLASKEAEEKIMNADNDGDGLAYKRELELGTSDWDTDSDDDGINDKEDAHPSGGGRYDAQYFEWNYQGNHRTWTLSVPEDWFLYYKNRPRIPHGASYVTYENESIKAIAKKLKGDAVAEGYHEVSFVVSFIQGLPYVADYNTGYDEYPKYPLETLIDRNGDCEDTSYLAAAIIEAMNIDTVLVKLPGHMAIGIWTDPDQPGTFYEIEGRRYYYFETTAEGWRLGQVPDEFASTPATIMKIPSNVIYNEVAPQYEKPCYASPDFPGYYYDGVNYYSDSQCINLAYCLPYEELYYNFRTKSFYWDSGCNQIVAKGCSKSTNYPGYFNNGIDYYSDSRCTQKARVCRSSPIYYDRYYDGYDTYWDSSCTQKVVSWCSKAIYHLGYFFSSLDYEYYYDYQCTQKADL